MQTKVVKVDPAKIDAATIKQAAHLIDAGGLVAFPTETVYGIACRVKTDPLNKLNELKGRTPDKPYSLHIGQKNEVKKYLPAIGLKARKLTDRAWPGPLTIVFELNKDDLEAQQKKLGEGVFENLYKDGSIGIRCPDDPVAAMLLQSTTCPVVAPSVNIAGQPPATDAQQILTQFNDKLDMVLDAGPSRYKQSSTVVRINRTELEILRPGVYSQTQLEEMSKVKILLVCTGNTCRSPMAEGLTRKYLAEKNGCTVDLLEKKGYKVVSAGTMGIVGLPPSAEAIAVCQAKGVDIKEHRSSALSQQLIEESDLIYVMGQNHLQQVLDIDPQAQDKCKLLAENRDIPDPIGRSQEIYDNVSELIEQAVKKRIYELLL